VAPALTPGSDGLTDEAAAPRLANPAAGAELRCKEAAATDSCEVCARGSWGAVGRSAAVDINAEMGFVSWERFPFEELSGLAAGPEEGGSSNEEIVGGTEGSVASEGLS